RVYVNRYAIMGRLAVLVPRTDKNVSLILTPEQANEPVKLVGGKDDYLPVGTIQPVTPEWMEMRFNQYGEPTTPKYLGWRTVLLCLISKRIITEKEAHKAFPLADGPAGDWYRQQLYELRARDGMLN